MKRFVYVIEGEPEVDMEKIYYGKTLSWSTTVGIRASKLLPTMGSGKHFAPKGARRARPGAHAGSDP